MNGAEYIVAFLHRQRVRNVFLVTGGACAFVVDAIGQHPEMDYTCFQHEQAAAMAADAIWRVNRTVGVTLATSGPGATNLLTGIACSYFDSIPSVHITGQVNKSESAAFLGATVRQAGFQETDIVSMAKPVTKYAVQVSSIEELKRELPKAWHLATSGRMGPVLIDVPMDVQKAEAGDELELENFYEEPAIAPDEKTLAQLASSLQAFLNKAERPVVLFGAGVGLAGVENEIAAWLEKHSLPFVSSWNALTYFNHDLPGYCGHIGVYGNRGANYILQNADAVLVLGSRLDNRQRSGNAQSFAPQANVFVLDVDGEELKKYAAEHYECAQINLKDLPPLLEKVAPPAQNAVWSHYLSQMKTRYFGKDVSTFAREHGSISPYAAVQAVNRAISDDAIVVADCGANLCWVYQIFHRTRQTLFTAGGMSPMGYSLPAAIGAALAAPDKQVVCFIGDGGLQMNIQEMQTIRHYRLDIKIVILNNYGYGIIKQFQDSYFGSRYEATGRGYSLPDFQALMRAYGFEYRRIDTLNQLTDDLIRTRGARVIDVTLDPNTLIEPKLEMGRPIHDQFPYATDEEFRQGNPFIPCERFEPSRAK